ncbi:MAG TPA: thioredoxin domain-containing protein, partial [Stellaceae bacterium]|nr:thioredoxin domain-containing protein [Stellaceae bacterium]
MSNALAGETSPYLLQHKDNPVQWRPWGPAALAAAKADDKPILLSIGYAACHWCHVMAHESFEDETVAAVMNALFVCIKVDREERPDLDAIYMQALHAMGEQGGWPLTMFLTPAAEPFWGGTYFPPTARYGRPGFPDVLRAISSAYRDKRDQVAKNVTALTTALAKLGEPASGAGVPMALVDQAALRLEQEVDRIEGGIGDAPKFPQVPLFALLWRAGKRLRNASLASAVTVTLDHICQGGIYDHLGGGFARYSVDRHWLAPHFEKMLYDNALLGRLYLDAGRALNEPEFLGVAREILEYVLREMTSPEGGFYSSQDADSEGEEGKFFLWTPAEAREAIADEEFTKIAARYFDNSEGGNFEGRNILNRTIGQADAAKLFSKSADEIAAAVETIKSRMF